MRGPFIVRKAAAGWFCVVDSRPEKKYVTVYRSKHQSLADFRASQLNETEQRIALNGGYKFTMHDPDVRRRVRGGKR